MEKEEFKSFIQKMIPELEKVFLVVKEELSLSEPVRILIDKDGYFGIYAAESDWSACRIKEGGKVIIKKEIREEL